MKDRKSGDSRLKPEVQNVSQRQSVNHNDDGLDNDVGSYVTEFLRGLPDAVVLESFSLSTPEQAKEALTVINATLERLNQQVANARALQRLVASKDDR